MIKGNQRGSTGFEGFTCDQGFAALQLNSHTNCPGVVAERNYPHPRRNQGRLQPGLHLGVGVPVPREEIHPGPVHVVLEVLHPRPPVLEQEELRELLAEAVGEPALGYDPAHGVLGPQVDLKELVAARFFGDERLWAPGPAALVVVEPGLQRTHGVDLVGGAGAELGVRENPGLKTQR